MKILNHILCAFALIGWGLFSSCVPGCSKSVRLDLDAINYVKAKDPRVRSVLAAFEDGSAFNAEFMHYPPTLKAEQRKQLRAHYEKTLPQLKGMLKKEAKFEFLYGTEFGVPPSHRLRFPMQNDSQEHPSNFEFLAGADKQTHLVVSAPGEGGVTFHIHMVVWEVDGRWKPIVLSSFPGVVRGVSAEDLLARTKEALGLGNDLLALSLCSLSESLARPIPYRVTGLQQEFAKITKELRTKLGVGKKPLLTLEVDGSEVEISEIGGIILSTDFIVELHSPVASIDDPKITEAYQQKIADAFKASQPRFKAHFQGIAVSQQSTDPAMGNRGFRSVRKYAD